MGEFDLAIGVARREHVGLDKEDLLDRLRRALTRDPRLMATGLKASGCACRETYRKFFGSLKAAWNAAGFAPHVPDEQDYSRVTANAAMGAQTCKTVFHLLRNAGVNCVYHRRPDRRSQTLLINGHVVLRTQVIWRRPRHGGLHWCLQKVYKGDFDWVFVVRINEDGSTFDSFLVQRRDYFALDCWLGDTLFGAWRVHNNLDEVANLFSRLAPCIATNGESSTFS